MRHVVVLLLAVTCSCPAVDVAAGDSRCMQSESPQFLHITEYVILDALDQVPASMASKSGVSMKDYLAALGKTPAPFPITDDLMGSDLIHVNQRWLVVKSYVTHVRRTAINAIESRPGVQQLVPPTPAVPGGAGVLAQPVANGITFDVGVARIFCGVRTAARSLAVHDEDVFAYGELVGVPTASEALRMIDP